MKTSNNLVWRESARRCQRPVDAVRQRPEWNGEARRPVDVCSAPTEAERRSQRPVDAVRQRPERRNSKKRDTSCDVSLFPERETAQDVQWTSALRRPERSVDLERSSPAGLDLTKKDIHRMSFLLKESARRDSNPRPRPWQGRAPPTEPLAHSLLCRLCLPDTFDIIQRE